MNAPHATSPGDLARALGVDPARGLSTEEHARRLASSGANSQRTGEAGRREPRARSRTASAPRRSPSRAAAVGGGRTRRQARRSGDGHPGRTRWALPRATSPGNSRRCAPPMRCRRPPPSRRALASKVAHRTRDASSDNRRTACHRGPPRAGYEGRDHQHRTRRREAQVRADELAPSTRHDLVTVARLRGHVRRHAVSSVRLLPICANTSGCPRRSGSMLSSGWLSE
jgi:hypothetical protein